MKELSDNLNDFTMTSKNILIIAPFPNDCDVKEGMMQRIAAIDEEIKHLERTYLHIYLYGKKRIRETKHIGNVTVEKVNFLFGANIVRNIISKADIIYCHSLYNLAFLLCGQLEGKKIILDLHGTVPEEMLFNNQKIKSKIYDKIENNLIRKVSDIICVSNSMINYYKRKYPELTTNYHLKPIFSIGSNNDKENNTDDNLKYKLGIKESDTVILYSGNLQRWQNIDLMLDIIGKLDNKNYKYLMLTGQPYEFSQKIIDNPNKDKFIIRSVKPDELGPYYRLSHYGFLLRDDIILNNVAAPTKLIEYLSYGIIPIMKTLKVGDFIEYNCDYLTISDDLENLKPIKSEKNRIISGNIKKIAIVTNIADLFK